MNMTIVEIGRGNNRKLVHWSQLIRIFFLPKGARFLPPGSRDWVENYERTQYDKKRVIKSTYDSARIIFLNELMRVFGGYTIKVIRWGFEGVNYTAYVLPGQKTGRKVALVETDWTLNALYVFDAGMDSWQKVAQMKKDNFNKKNRGNYPEFVKTMNHNGSFKKRLVNFIKGY